MPKLAIDRADVADGRVLTVPVVEGLAVREDGLDGFLASLAMDRLDLRERQKLSVAALS